PPEKSGPSAQRRNSGNEPQRLQKVKSNWIAAPGENRLRKRKYERMSSDEKNRAPMPDAGAANHSPGFRHFLTHRGHLLPLQQVAHSNSQGEQRDRDIGPRGKEQARFHRAFPRS